jgi:hypothetical protein
LVAHAAVLDEEKGRMLVFGGGPFGKKPYSKSPVYALDLTEMKWSCKNDVQYKRYSHTANVIGDFVYLFGGNYAKMKNDIH